MSIKTLVFVFIYSLLCVITGFALTYYLNIFLNLTNTFEIIFLGFICVMIVFLFSLPLLNWIAGKL